MSSSDRLTVLPAAQRNELEQLLFQFDQDWTPDLVGEYLNRLAPETDRALQKLAITELVKIDLQRRWSANQGKLLEEYLRQIPALGTAETIEPDLILVEYAARHAVYPAVNLDGYAARFPQQFPRLKKLAAESADSLVTEADNNAAQQSVDTSREGSVRDTLSTPATQTELPTQFGRYRILRELGSGAMGKVYLAHDSQLDRQVALKTPSFEGGEEDELVARFYREARAAAKIQHRNICPIYDVGEIDGRHFISMGFIKGRCMSEYITPDNPPPPKTSAILVHRIATALAEAHRHNVVHRDLKPANIMIDTKREPVVMDFGLARETDTDSRMTQSGMMVGTPAYMSPEQVTGEPSQVGPASDIFALGVILYELLTGNLPFRGSIVQVVHQITSAEPTPPSQLRSEVDPELEAVCAKMMAKRRDERFTSMDEVATALKGYLKGKKRKQTAEAEPPPLIMQTVVDQKLASDSDVSPTPGTETQALNAYFTTETRDHDEVKHTAVELSLSPSDSRNVRKRRTKIHHKYLPRTTAWIGGFGAVIIVLLGVVLLVKAPTGTMRVETVGALDGLEVLVDGHSIRLNSAERLAARDHELALKLNGALLTLDPTASRFVLKGSGQDLRLAVSIDDLEISSKQFTVTKNAETVLKIQVLNLGQPFSPRAAAVDSATSEHWTSLFNGKDLTGWVPRDVDNSGGWVVDDGAIHTAGHREGGHLRTADKYRDFELEFEWKLKGQFSGVFYRETEVADRWLGMEYVIGEDRRTFSGALCGVQGPSRRCSKPAGEWNTARVVARGKHIQHWLNGQKVVDIQIGSKQWRENIARIDYKFANYEGFGESDDGFILLQRQQGPVWFRNIRIRKLDIKPPLAVAPFDSEQARQHQEAWAKYLGVPVGYENSVGMKFVLIPPGEFMMGATQEEIDYCLREARSRKIDTKWMKETLPSEQPQHRVRISQPFYLGIHEITCGQFHTFITDSEYRTVAYQNGGGGRHRTSKGFVDEPSMTWDNALGFKQEYDEPVAFVRRTDAHAFCRWLSQEDGFDYRLPTEAQWEYTCRAGTESIFFFGTDPSELQQYAWYRENSGWRTHPVGKLEPNPFGLYDMLGNVRELCNDWLSYTYYQNGPVDDPAGPLKPVEKKNPEVVRGGAFSADNLSCRSAKRTGDGGFNVGTGFRVVLDVDGVGRRLENQP